MGWVEDLRGKTVGLDTAPLIYYIEDHPTYAELLAPFFEAVRSGETRIVTSTVTLLEVLVHPLKHGDESLAHEYNDILLSSPHILTVPVTPGRPTTADPHSSLVDPGGAAASMRMRLTERPKLRLGVRYTNCPIAEVAVAHE